MTFPFCFENIIEINLPDQLLAYFTFFFYSHKMCLLYSAFFGLWKNFPLFFLTIFTSLCKISSQCWNALLEHIFLLPHPHFPVMTWLLYFNPTFSKYTGAVHSTTWFSNWRTRCWGRICEVVKIHKSCSLSSKMYAKSPFSHWLLSWCSRTPPLLSKTILVSNLANSRDLHQVETNIE